ncbi:MAG: hypothetical protein ACJ74W_03760 [Pyrinomonadaceae bacterium]
MTEFDKMIREAAKVGANFPGHYAVIGWSCGMICINLTVVDVRTSKIYNTPFLGIADGPGCPDRFYDDERRLVYIRPDSRLLILRGAPEDYDAGGGGFHDSPCSTRYYVWRKHRLVLLREVFPRN